MTSNRVVALIAAVVLGVVGAWGLILAVLSTNGDTAGVLLPGDLGTSLPLALVHLVLAAALAIGFLRDDRAARLVNRVSGSALFAVGMFGLFAVSTPANVIGLTGASNLLHFAASSMLLAAGIGAAARNADAGSRQPSHEGKIRSP